MRRDFRNVKVKCEVCHKYTRRSKLCLPCFRNIRNIRRERVDRELRQAPDKACLWDVVDVVL